MVNIITTGILSAFIFTILNITYKKYWKNIIYLEYKNNIIRENFKIILKDIKYEFSKNKPKHIIKCYGYHPFDEYIDSSLFTEINYPKFLNDEVRHCRRNAKRFEKCMTKIKYKYISDSIKNDNSKEFGYDMFYLIGTFNDSHYILNIEKEFFSNFINSSTGLDIQIKKYKNHIINKLGISLIIFIVLYTIIYLR